ncbi:MAG: DUF1553 domain-containing protein, partial [Planctomycetes bacterium]|nr:DUF1553 domain-containing protein [Planctomycetota bacterium]
RLEAKGISFSPDADRITLARRAYLDLWGVPPHPEEIDTFLADSRADAYEQLLDRLLASPRFGERWGRHWLDVVGYADTIGFDIDSNNIILSEGKWRYRDYVIAAFNRDKPYNEFVTEQLAGDELVDWRNAPRFTPKIRERLIATGFLRTARDQSHEPESNIPLTYFGVLHDTVSIVGNSLLGLTLNCAQCHNHKFDPISQKDYYRLMAVFTPAYNPRNWKPVYPWKPEIHDRGLPDVSATEQAQIEKHNREIERRVSALNQQLATLRRPTEDRLLHARLQALPEPIRADTRAAIETPPARRTPVQKYLAGKFEAALRIKPEEVTASLSAADKAAAGTIQQRIAALNQEKRSFGKIQALYDVGPPPRTYLLKRGNYERPGEEVEPGLLSVLSDPARPASVSPRFAGPTSGRRSALASSLTERDSWAAALLARVMVNRLWQHLFGRGIVPTPENFGLSGEPPTHPELLEWLSGEFVHSGWRIKPMLKLMMMSSAYRQRSQSGSTVAHGTVDPEKVDPANHLLWRMRLRRLEAEAIRDSILAVSGQLDSRMGGPPVLLNALPSGLVVIEDKKLPDPAAKDRRSVYLLFRRAYNLSLLSIFDQPPVALNCPNRDTSAVPLQSLTMLNDPFLAEQARHLADRLARSGASSGAPARGGRAIIDAAFRLVLSRPPDAAEAAICSQLLAREAAVFRQAGRPPHEAERLALVQLCHTLLNTSEFLYVE